MWKIIQSQTETYQFRTFKVQHHETKGIYRKRIENHSIANRSLPIEQKTGFSITSLGECLENLSANNPSHIETYQFNEIEVLHHVIKGMSRIHVKNQSIASRNLTIQKHQGSASQAPACREQADNRSATRGRRHRRSQEQRYWYLLSVIWYTSNH